MALSSMLLAAVLQSLPPSAAAAAAELIFVPPLPLAVLQETPAARECLAMHRVRSARIISGTGIEYELTRRERFINRVRGRARGLAQGQVMLVRSSGPLLCAGDTVYILDGTTGAVVSFVGLGRFEPIDSPARTGG